ncbi:MAG: hypothetical protein OEZ36_10415 [Spirochaetota bacterium]|nr:hypothetical protein [Spirochaetota bacterium]
MKRLNKLWVYSTLILAMFSGLTFGFEYDEYAPEEIFISERPDEKTVSEGDNPELEGIVTRHRSKVPDYHKDKRMSTHPLHLNRNDIRLEKRAGGEYFDLYIKKKKYVNSVLLTNYFWEVSNEKVREYGLRSLSYNAINGDEKRLYKKSFIGRDQGLYFLVDSSPERDPQFGQAFKIRIPKYVVYGYRRGTDVYGIMRIQDGVKLNIRTFNRKYSDYRGKFKNNPIVVVFRDKPSTVKDHPVLTKIKEELSEEYLGVQVQFLSKGDFFKSFLVREDSEKNFHEIGFNNKDIEHRRAVLIEAFYKGGVGRILKAVIYFKRGSVPKKYFISAIDKGGMHSVGRVEVKVPAAIGSEASTSTGTTDKTHSTDIPATNGEEEFWYNEGDF